MIRKFWNGIRTDRKKKTQTIDTKLKRYSYYLCIVVALMGILMFMIIFVYMGIYNRMIGSVYWLEEVQEETKNLQAATVKYVSLGEEEVGEKFTDLYGEIRANIGKLGEMNIEENFRRNLTDLEHLVDRYEEIQTKIIQKNSLDQEKERTQEILEESLEDYETMESIYFAMLNRENFLNKDLSAYINRENRNMRRKFIPFFWTVLIAFVTGFLLLWLNTRRLAREISRPIKKLTRRAQKIAEGDLDGIMPEEQEALECQVVETEVLADAFQIMLHRIQDQVVELKESMAVREQLKEQEMENLRIINLLTTSELQCLQMQMNPHFLFNTLNMIQQTVYLDKKEKTSFLLKETAAFLRYSLDYVGKNVPLCVELEALGNYISLQEERLGERILFEFELDESINQMRVPSLILQPLVENSLIHGVGDKRKNALIHISTNYLEEEQCGCISIADNGHGICPEKLSEIREQLKKKELVVDKSIGLTNVYKRLELFTEGKATMTIESEPEKGTTVTLKIHYSREK